MTPRVLLLLSVLAVHLAAAGTNGTLEGTVRDHRTAEPLPGVNIVVVGTQRGAVTDTAGYFIVADLRAGRYDLRVTHIGHQSYLLKGVMINPDLRTRIRIDLEPADLTLDEMVIVQEKPLIQRDITGTMHALTVEETDLLPLDNAVEALRAKPGVTAEGNVRGGKSTEVIYLVDGLPVQDVLSGGMSSRLPNSSITGISLYTGGFEAEYGNALSGVVNIVTRTGSDDHRFSVRADVDRVAGITQTDRAKEFDVSASGPVKGSRLYYLASLNGLFTDTRWWQDLQHFFTGPFDRTMNGFGKLDYLFTPTFRLSAQVLYSDHAWRDYEFAWRFDLGGLPAQRRTSHRIAAMVSQAVSESFYYTASLSRYAVQSAINDGDRAAVTLRAPYEYDFFLRYVVQGDRMWWSRTSQQTYTGRFDGAVTLSREHLLKFGAEFNQYDLTADIVRYEPKKTYFGKPIAGAVPLNFSTSYGYRPRSGSAYVQSKIDLPDEGILFNFGLRYDFLDPTAERPDVRAVAQADTGYTFSVNGNTPASLKQQFSPRFGAAMQLSDRGYLFVNLGWYFQYPLFEYLYTGLDRVALARGIGAITGNPDLEPERSKVWEIALRYSVPPDIVVSAAYFQKECTDLIDTKTFIPGDSKLSGGFGFAEYVNNPYALVRGFELVVARDRGAWVTGEVSYTYMVTEAVSGSAYDGFYIAQYGLPPGQRTYPLSWDQQHTLKGVVYTRTTWGMTISSLLEWHSGRPYTAYPTSTGFEKIKGGLFVVNNARMPAYTNIDLKVDQSFVPGWWQGSVWTVYLDCRNVLDEANIRWVDSNGRVGGELDDPSGYFVGRRTSLGMKVEF